MKHTLAILSLLCLSACSKKESIPTDNPFADYSAQIPAIKLPLQTDCNEELKFIKTSLADSLISKYGIDNAKVYGTLAKTDKYTAVIYLYPGDGIVPIIKTTDKKGNRISELPLFAKCGEDEFSHIKEWASINEQLVIQLRDSSVTYQRDTTGNIIESTRKTEKNSKWFSIDKNGKIRENSNVSR